MQLLTLTNFKGIILIAYFLGIIMIILFSWLYLTRTVRATRAVGLQAPEYIKILVRVSIINAVVTAFLIAFFLFTKMY